MSTSLPMRYRAQIMVALLGALCFDAAPSQACGPGGTSGASVAPAQGTVVPRNIPAVYVFPGKSYSFTCQLSSVGFTQHALPPITLSPSATEPDAYLLSGPLQPGGAYTIEHDSNCALDNLLAVSFVAGGSRPLPAETGKLSVVSMGVGAVSWSDGSCNWGQYGAWVQLRLRPACDLIPFLPVTRFVTEIDGKPWMQSGVGSTTVAGNEFITSRTVDILWASCGANAPGPGVTPGKKLITVRAEVAGAAVQPAPAELSVDLDCATDGGETSPPSPPLGLVDLSDSCATDVDAAAPIQDAAVPSQDAADGSALDAAAGAAGVDAGVVSQGGLGGSAGAGGNGGCCDAALPTATATDAGGGCTHAGRKAPAPMLVLGGLLFGVWLVRRARRT